MRRFLPIMMAIGVTIGCGGEELPTAESRAKAIVRGKALYAQHGCAVCHGPEGRGDGPVARSMRPPPRDFRDSEAFAKGRSLGAISETIKTGVMNKGVGMPGYPHIPEEERRAIGAYVASLGESD